MSKTALTAARDVRGLRCPEKCVLFMMADHANEFEGNLCWVSQKKLAAECGLSARSVMRIQKLLIEKGHIAPARQDHYAGNGDARNWFIVHPKTGVSLSPVSGDNGDRNRCQPRQNQVTTATGTGDNGDIPNISTSKHDEASKKRVILVSEECPALGVYTAPLIAHRPSEAFMKEMMATLRNMLGDTEMNTNGGQWVNRIKSHPGAIEMSIKELKIRLDGVRAGVVEPIRNRAAWLTDMFERIKTEQRANAKAV